jgi:hypothetical protein
VSNTLVELSTAQWASFKLTQAAYQVWGQDKLARPTWDFVLAWKEAFLKRRVSVLNRPEKNDKL